MDYSALTVLATHTPLYRRLERVNKQRSSPAGRLFSRGRCVYPRGQGLRETNLCTAEVLARDSRTRRPILRMDRTVLCSWFRRNNHRESSQFLSGLAGRRTSEDLFKLQARVCERS